MIPDEILGGKLKEVVSNYGASEDAINMALDKAEDRSGFAKFFIGPNYKQLEEAKAEMEQNRLRIADLNQVMEECQNEADKSELRLQINTLEEQNTALDSQIDGDEEVFSLLGWLVKLVGGYN